MEQLLQRIPEDRLPVARKIVEIAKSQGVDPALALAVALQESGLDQSKVGGVGEIGIMQVRPSTGKMLGFKEEELKQPDTNILAGVTYLRQGIDRFGDPLMAVAGYNAGHDHPFFTSPKKSQLPESTRNYVKSIASLGVFEPQPEREPPEITEAKGELTPIPEQPRQRVTFADMGQKLMEMGAESDVGQLSADVAGAVLGTKVAGMMAGKPQGGALPTAAPSVAPTAAPGTSPIITSSKGALPPAQGPIQGPPAGGRMTQNWIRAQDVPGAGAYEDVAQKARSMSEAHQMKEAAIQAENKIRAMAPEMRQQPNRAGLFLPSQEGAGPRGARTQPIPQVKGPSAFQRGSARMAAMPRLPGAIGGIGVAEGLMETERRVGEGDMVGAGISALGTVGGAAAMTPFGPARLVGTAAATASPLAMYLYDKMRGKRESNMPLPLIYRSRYGG
jgi:hypothetical protein